MTRDELISEIDIFKGEKKMKSIVMGTQMPGHLDLAGSSCCGFFNDLRDTGLYCNECSKELSEALGEFYNEIMSLLRAMWGGTQQGVFMDFRNCETNAKDKWLAFSRKMGILNEE